MELVMQPESCPNCQSEEVSPHKKYQIKTGEERQLYYCTGCQSYFSETKNTFLFRLRTSISRIILILNNLTEGQGINATTRIFNVGKNSLYRWQDRLSKLQKTLLLYALCDQFFQQMIEGDEVYTKVNKNLPPEESQGWTIILMDRASRFLWQMECGRKERKLFRKVMRTLAKVIKKTGDLSLLTDGERRYGNLLFEICAEVLREGKQGRPKTTLPKNVKVRVKNKGSQAHKRGPKRPKYQAPQAEHSQTQQNLKEKDIHANHVEAFNSSLRRKCAAFRRKTNTYAKKRNRLQERLDTLWVVHNFVRVHFTTKKVPAVVLGILEEGLTWIQLFSIRIAF
jgi:transposase-like protein